MNLAAELTVRSGAISGSTFPLGEAEVVLGRGPEADVRFDPREDLSVSTVHAGIAGGKDGWVLYDLESLNGTFLNGESISKKVRLRNGDLIQLGADGQCIAVPAARARSH